MPIDPKKVKDFQAGFNDPDPIMRAIGKAKAYLSGDTDNDKSKEPDMDADELKKKKGY